MPMRAISNEDRFEGLKPFAKPDPRYPFDGYIASRHFVMIEIVRNGYAMDFYLRPTADGQCLFCAGLPYLDLLDLLKDDKSELLRFMSQSPSVSQAIRHSFGQGRDLGKIHFAKLKDFTEPLSGSLVWCIAKLLPVKVSPHVMDDRSPDSAVVEQAMNEAVLLANDYFLLYDAYDQRPANHLWVKNSIVRKDARLIDHLLASGLFSYFLMPRKEMQRVLQWRGESEKQMFDSWLDNPGCALLTRGGTGIRYENAVIREDFNGMACLMVNVNMLCPASGHEDYVFLIELHPQAGNVWKPSLVVFDGLKDVFQKMDTLYSYDNPLSNIASLDMPFTWLVGYYQQPESVQEKMEGRRNQFVKRCGTGLDKLAQRCKIDDAGLSLAWGRDIVLGHRWTGLDDVGTLIHAGLLIMNELTRLDASKYKNLLYLNIFRSLLFVGVKLTRAYFRISS